MKYVKPTCFYVVICKIYKKDNEIINELNDDSVKVIKRLVKHDTEIDKILTTPMIFKNNLMKN